MKFTAHAYQKYCITRLLTDMALGLFLDMGLGKTAITLTAVNDLKYNRFAVFRVLVIAPKKVAETTWSKEAAKWDHLQRLRVVPVLGSRQKRIKALNTPGDVWVINRENVKWLVEYYRNAWPFDMVVIDELTSFKSHTSERWKALRMVRRHIKRIVGLTGTPAPNGLIDLWAQVYLLDEGERLGAHIGGFRERYFDPDARNRDRVFSYAPKPGADDAIRKLIGDICVSMRAEDYLSLPPITYNAIPVKLDGPAQKAYDRLEEQMVLEIEDQIIDAGTAAVLGNKLLQLCNGAVYDGEHNAVEIHKCKLEAFLELIEGLNGKPAMVFYSFRHDLQRIRAVLKDSKLRIRELRTPEDERAWNAREVDILLAHPASAAYGLNLQDGGNHVVWFSRPWALELYQQANKRLHRQGQKERVIVHHLDVVGGVDEDVAAALGSKTATQDNLMLALRARVDKYKSMEGAK